MNTIVLCLHENVQEKHLDLRKEKKEKKRVCVGEENKDKCSWKGEKTNIFLRGN
jgi:hypothetical protein